MSENISENFKPAWSTWLAPKKIQAWSSESARATRGEKCCWFLLLIAGSGFRVSGFGFRISCVMFRASGCGLRFSSIRFRVSGFGLRILGLGFWVLDFRFRVSNFRITNLSLEVEPVARGTASEAVKRACARTHSEYKGDPHCPDIRLLADFGHVDGVVG